MDYQGYDKLVAMGMGIGIGRESVLPKDGNSRTKIVNLNVSDFNEHYTVYVYYRESDYLGSIRKLIDFMKDNAG